MRSFVTGLCTLCLLAACDKKSEPAIDTDTAVEADTAIVDDLIPDTEASDDLVPDAASDEEALLPDDACVNIPVEDAFLEQIAGYDAYLAFRAVGMINPADAAPPAQLFQSKFVVVLPGHPDTTLDQAAGFILEGELSGNATIEMDVLGDPGTMFYESLTVVILLKEWLITNREALLAEPVVEEAPFVQVMTVEALSQTVVKKCIIAISALDPEHLELPAPGRMQLSVCDNIDFSAEENLRIGVNAKLTEDVPTILSLLGLTDEAELCSCADAATNETVECP